MANDDNRLFLAFPAEQLAPALEALQHRLALPGRRIPAHQLHLTLHFLGQCSPEQQSSLLTQLDRLPLPGIELELDRLGCFPLGRRGVAGAEPAAAGVNDPGRDGGAEMPGPGHWQAP